MAYVNPLDPTTPLGSDAVSAGDDMFRSVKAALIERMDSFFTGHDIQPWQAKSGSGAASLWIVSDAAEAVTRLAYTGAGSRSVELFANATVAGLRDTTGPLTILSYTYSSALTVLNTTGSMQLKVGVGQTIQTIVNGVTIGTWSSTGFTVATGTTAVQALTATSVATSTAFNAYHVALASTGTVVTGGLYVGSNGFAGIHLIASSNHGIGFAVNNGAPSLSIANTGAVTIASGLTISSGGLTVASGTTSLQLVTATQMTTPTLNMSGAGSDSLGGAPLAQWVNGTSGVILQLSAASHLDFWGDVANSVARIGRITNTGIFAWGTTVTTSAGQGDMVLANTKALRGNDASGTNTYRLIFVDANNVIQVGDSGSNNLVAIPRGAGIAASANFKGGLHMDSGTAGQLVFFDGVTGARYKLTGTAF